MVCEFIDVDFEEKIFMDKGFTHILFFSFASVLYSLIKQLIIICRMLILFEMGAVEGFDVATCDMFKREDKLESTRVSAS